MMGATVEETALLDSIALNDAAKDAGVTLEQARRLVAAIGEMPVEQAARIIGKVSLDRHRALMRRAGR